MKRVRVSALASVLLVGSTLNTNGAPITPLKTTCLEETPPPGAYIQIASDKIHVMNGFATRVQSCIYRYGKPGGAGDAQNPFVYSLGPSSMPDGTYDMPEGWDTTGLLLDIALDLGLSGAPAAAKSAKDLFDWALVGSKLLLELGGYLSDAIDGGVDAISGQLTEWFLENGIHEPIDLLLPIYKLYSPPGLFPALTLSEGSPAHAFYNVTFKENLPALIYLPFVAGAANDGDELQVIFNSQMLWSSKGLSLEPGNLYAAGIPTDGLSGVPGLLTIKLSDKGAGGGSFSLPHVGSTATIYEYQGDDPTTSVPEPSPLGLLAGGTAGCVALKALRSKRRRVRQLSA